MNDENIMVTYTHPAQTSLFVLNRVYPIKAIKAISRYKDTYRTYFTPINCTWEEVDELASKIALKSNTDAIVSVKNTKPNKTTRTRKNKEESQ